MTLDLVVSILERTADGLGALDVRVRAVEARGGGLTREEVLQIVDEATAVAAGPEADEARQIAAVLSLGRLVRNNWQGLIALAAVALVIADWIGLPVPAHLKVPTEALPVVLEADTDTAEEATP